MQYHVDGQLVPRSEATVSVEDRGFRYGDAAFETTRAYGGDVFRWPSHVRRLRRTCETLGMPAAVPDGLAVRVASSVSATRTARSSGTAAGIPSVSQVRRSRRTWLRHWKTSPP